MRREGHFGKQLLLKGAVTVDVSEKGPPHEHQAEGGFGGVTGSGDVRQAYPKRVLTTHTFQKESGNSSLKSENLFIHEKTFSHILLPL